jgi:hypothetical protein
MTEKSSAILASGAGNPPVQPRSDLNWRRLAYYVGVPLVFAIYASLNNWEMLNIGGVQASLLFYLAHSLLPWLTTCSITTVLMRVLARWKPPWALLLILGHTLACLIVVPYSSWLATIYEARWPELHITGASGVVLTDTLWMYLRAGIIWFGVNFIFDRFLGLPLYRYEIPRGYGSQEKPTSGNSRQVGWGKHTPGFIERLPAALDPEEVLAIKAEQHYIRVFSPDKEYMVLYRFSDAIRELDESLGSQVHRSYWVNRTAIQSVHARAKDFHVRIGAATDIPVSTPYQGMIRELARSARLPLRG